MYSQLLFDIFPPYFSICFSVPKPPGGVAIRSGAGRGLLNPSYQNVCNIFVKIDLTKLPQKIHWKSNIFCVIVFFRKKGLTKVYIHACLLHSVLPLAVYASLYSVFIPQLLWNGRVEVFFPGG